VATQPLAADPNEKNAFATSCRWRDNRSQKADVWSDVSTEFVSEIDVAAQFFGRVIVVA